VKKKTDKNNFRRVEFCAEEVATELREPLKGEEIFLSNLNKFVSQVAEDQGILLSEKETEGVVAFMILQEWIDGIPKDYKDYADPEATITFNK